MTHAHGEGEPEGSPASRAGEQPWGVRAGDAQPPFGATQPYGHLPADFRPPGRAPRPPWDQPAGDPPAGPARRRTGLVVALAVTVLAVVAGLGLLALATGPTVLSRAAVERDVAAQFEEREGVSVDLRCAQEMPVEQGAVYECSGITADDEQITLRIEITDAHGARYTWSEP